MSQSKPAPRTYNQVHIPRKQTPGRRRMSIYVTWSFPAETNRDITELDNRFSTMTDVRRVEWPNWEGPEWSDRGHFQRGIAGSLELFFKGWVPFQEQMRETTGHAVPLFQRVDQSGTFLPLDERILDDTDTLFLFGLDHSITEQLPSQDEIDALKNFLAREGTCLVIGPHHEVGISEDREVRDVEYRHHGDALIPRTERFAAYCRGLMKGLEIPVENHYGLRPELVKGSRSEIAPHLNHDRDKRGWLEGVTTLNFHKHLPHYAVTDENNKSVHVLARQPIDASKPHPFLQAGNTEFNSLVYVEPDGKRLGDILFADSTVFSTLFGGNESLSRFWNNLSK